MSINIITQAKPMSYAKAPPKEFLTNAIANIDKYNEALAAVSWAGYSVADLKSEGVEFSPEQELIRSKNNAPALKQAMFANHPNVPRGYYDKLEDGVLMVKTPKGDLIRKDASSLTMDGEFVPSVSVLQSIPLEFLCLVSDFYRRNGISKESVKNKYFPDGYRYILIKGSVFKVTPEQLSLGITPTKLSTILGVVSMEVARNHPDLVRGLFKNRSTLSVEKFKELISYIPTYVNSLHEYFQIVLKANPGVENGSNVYTLGEDHPLFPGLNIVSGETNFMTTQNLGILQRPGVLFDSFGGAATTQAGVTPMGRMWGNAICLNDIGILPATDLFTFYVNVVEKPKLTINRETGNNRGMVENYSLKVPDYKVSFLMTDSEKQQYKEDNTSKPIFLGFELEFALKVDPEGGRKDSYLNKTVKEIADSPLGNHTVLKNDSSIHDIGFEMVSIPATLDYHKEMMKTHFFDSGMCKRLLGTDHCGLHVHIGKDAFAVNGKRVEFTNVVDQDKGCVVRKPFITDNGVSRLAMGKFIAFMNDPANRSFIEDLAGRSTNEYCQADYNMAGVNSNGVHRGIKSANRISKTEAATTQHERRRIVNLANSHTIEVRIFKSTNEESTLFRRLEFCEALVNFSKVASMRHITVYHFIDFLLLKENCNRYTNLLSWCHSRKHVGMERRKTQGDKYVRFYGPNNLKNPLDKPVKVDSPEKKKRQTGSFTQVTNVVGTTNQLFYV